MNLPLPTGPLLAAFIAATLVLAVTPGPGVVYIVTRTLAQGRTAGLASVAGVASGNLANAVGASLGLAALFAVSASAFSLAKFAGAAYLVWLGVQALRCPPLPADALPGPVSAERARIFRDGFLVALLNPKTTLFFAAFLPQFIDAAAPAAAQSLALSAIFVVIAAGTDSAYVLLASLVAPALRTSHSARSRGRFGVAAVYFGLGVWTLLAGARPGRPSTR